MRHRAWRGWGAVHMPRWKRTSTTRWLHICLCSFNNGSLWSNHVKVTRDVCSSQRLNSWNIKLSFKWGICKFYNMLMAGFEPRTWGLRSEPFSNDSATRKISENRSFRQQLLTFMKTIFGREKQFSRQFFTLDVFFKTFATTDFLLKKTSTTTCGWWSWRWWKWRRQKRRLVMD